MAWRRSGDKPLSESMMISLLTHIKRYPDSIRQRGCARQKQASSATKFSIKPAYEMWIEVVSRPLQAKIESNHGNSWPRELAGDNVLEIDWNICVNIGSSNGFATNRRQTTICANFHHDAWRHMAFLCLNMLIPTYANNTSLSVGVYRW